VPFVRVSRDKRGYEHIYLFEVSSRRPSKPRILYWFRTPPGVRVGREPFDEPVKRALEAQNPGVTFDWKKLASDTHPPPDVENWRERRRAEREAKRARKGDEEETASEGDEEPVDQAQPSEVSAGGVGGMPGGDLTAEPLATVGVVSDPPAKPLAAGSAGDASSFGRNTGGGGEASSFGRHRRRRRGGRHRQSTHKPNVQIAPQVNAPPAEQAETNRTLEAADAASADSSGTGGTRDSSEVRVTAGSSEVTAGSSEEN
jgi:hypothetical protein